MAQNTTDNSARNQTNRNDLPANGASRPPGLNREAARRQREAARREARDPKAKIIEPEDDYTPPPFSLSGIRNGMVHSMASKILMLLMILIFAVGFLLMGGGPPSNAPVNGQPTNKANAPDPIATVAGQDISRAQFEQSAQQQLQYAAYFGQAPNPTNLLGLQQNVLQQLAGQATLVKAAQDAGFKATDDEINARIEKEVTSQITQQSGGNPAASRRLIEQQYGSEEKYREQLRTGFDRDRVAQAIAVEKYQKQWQDKNKATEADYQKSLTKLNLRMIVARPQTPAPGDLNMGAAIQKNKADAKARIEKIAAQLKGLQGPALIAKFAQLAQSGSDDIATKTKGGVLGLKAPAELPMGQEAKDAVQAASALPALVGPIEDTMTNSWGLYLVQGRQLDLPKDYAKNKATLLKTFQEQNASTAWQQYTHDLSKKADIQINDPALDAYKTQSSPAIVTAKVDDGQALLQKYQDALTYASGEEAAAIHYQRAQLYRDMKQTTKYTEELRAAAQSAQNALPVHLELARALRENKDTAGAIKELQAASKQLESAPPAPSMFGGNPNDALHAQIAEEFQTLGRTDLATAERKKIAPPSAAPGSPGAPGGFGGLGQANNVITIPGNTAAKTTAPTATVPGTTAPQQPAAKR
ncbi:MAG TPA: SurA N-terminal domain-containing protein [Abditibacteriaceae bacterium]|jgi:hypothetical protein|nr:SurA N-terminal domain-containing protein [Abditibacteriaceae bacterium]